MIRIIRTRGLKGEGHVAGMEESKNVFKILTGKYTIRKSLGRPRHR